MRIDYTIIFGIYQPLNTWLNEQGAVRFWRSHPIQRDYELDEFRRDAEGFDGSVHIQVGAADGLAEALWVQGVADANLIGRWFRSWRAI